jgi:hypothetical protein
MEFAAIGWGDDRSTVEEKLRTASFSIAGEEGGDVAFRGRVAGYDGEGWAYFAKGHAVKVVFIVRPPPNQVLGTYDGLRSWLVRDYGQTRHEVESYQAPYAAGDGRALEALRAGRAIIASAWKDGPESGRLSASDPGVILRVGSDLTVKLAYEGPGWTKEVARRRISRASG